jgi:acyl-CoA synthetase (AMP-forming)/AMP-acid ligase II
MTVQKRQSRLPSATLAEPWNRLNVAGLVTSAAAAQPSRQFLADCPQREAWGGQEPRRLTFSEFAAQAQFFAAQMETLGLVPGERVLILLPNCVEAPVALAGCLMAGLTPALLSMADPLESQRIAAERVQAVAIITTGKVDDLRPGEIARQIAARVMTIRVVAGFGFDLPDGIIPLDGWSEQDLDTNPNRPARQQDDEALIVFRAMPEGIVGFARNEAQLLADALALAARHKLGKDQVLVSTLLPAGAAAVAAGFLMPLFLGAGVQLVGPYQAARLQQALAQAGSSTSLLAPAALIDWLGAHGPAMSTVHPTQSIALFRPDDLGLRGEQPGVTPLFDLLDEALVVPAALPAGLAALHGPHLHPMEGVLPAGEPYLLLTAGDDGVTRAFGFAAAERLTRQSELGTAAA